MSITRLCISVPLSTSCTDFTKYTRIHLSTEWDCLFPENSTDFVFQKLPEEIQSKILYFCSVINEYSLRSRDVLTQMIRFWIPPMMLSDRSAHTTWTRSGIDLILSFSMSWIVMRVNHHRRNEPIQCQISSSYYYLHSLKSCTNSLKNIQWLWINRKLNQFL